MLQRNVDRWPLTRKGQAVAERLSASIRLSIYHVDGHALPCKGQVARRSWRQVSRAVLCIAGMVDSDTSAESIYKHRTSAPQTECFDRILAG